MHCGRLAGGTLVVSPAALDADGTIDDRRAGAAAPEPTIASLADAPGLRPRVTCSTVGERALRTAAAAAVLARAGHAAARAHGPLRRAARPACGRRPRRAPDQPVVRRPGLRGRRRRRPRHAGPRPGVRARGARATSPPRCSTTRSTPCTRVAATTRTSTSPGSASAAGRSAATSPRSPCCAGRTSSTPPSPARPSPTGRSTTPTTPSATSATPPSSPTPTPGPRCSPTRAKLTRPLLLVHGLADDNVVAAHTLRLSSALLAAGRPHSVLPLSGVTHMTPQEVVAENLLLLQVRVPARRARTVHRRDGRVLRRLRRPAVGDGPAATPRAAIDQRDPTSRDGPARPRRPRPRAGVAAGRGEHRVEQPRRAPPSRSRPRSAAAVCSAPPAEPAMSTGTQRSVIVVLGATTRPPPMPARSSGAATAHPADAAGASSSTERGRRGPSDHAGQPDDGEQPAEPLDEPAADERRSADPSANGVTASPDCSGE